MKKYWEFWLDERERSIRMSYVVLIQFIVIFFLSYALVKITTAPKPVYVVPMSTKPSIIYPNRYTKTVVRDFVERYLNLLYTYTPSNIKENYATAEQYISPELYQEAEYEMNQNLQSALNQGLSSVVYIKKISVKKIAEDQWKVTVSAVIKQFFAGNTPIVKNVSFTVYLKAGSATEKNPYGLYIYSLVVSGGK